MKDRRSTCPCPSSYTSRHPLKIPESRSCGVVEHLHRIRRPPSSPPVPTSEGGIDTTAGLADKRMPMTSEPSSGRASQNAASLAAA